MLLDIAALAIAITVFLAIFQQRVTPYRLKAAFGGTKLVRETNTETIIQYYEHARNSVALNGYFIRYRLAHICFWVSLVSLVLAIFSFAGQYTSTLLVPSQQLSPSASETQVPRPITNALVIYSEAGEIEAVYPRGVESHMIAVDKSGTVKIFSESDISTSLFYRNRDGDFFGLGGSKAETYLAIFLSIFLSIACFALARDSG